MAVQAAARNCTQPGCPGLVRDGRCSVCGPRKKSNWASYQEGSSHERGYGATWRKLRAMVLAEQPLCVACQTAGVVRAATQVDHIVPRKQGGLDTFGNLQGLCEEHHRTKTAQDSNATPRRYVTHEIRPSKIPVTIVAGPPGSGKTTYVMKHKRHGDLVVDVDALYVALSALDWYDKPVNLLPFVCEARDAVIARLGRQSDVGRAWIITGESDVGKLRELKQALGAERMVIVQASPSDCRKRIAGDERRAEMVKLYDDLIRSWFDIFEATRDDSTAVAA